MWAELDARATSLGWPLAAVTQLSVTAGRGENDVQNSMQGEGGSGESLEVALKP